MELMHLCPCCGKNPAVCPCTLEERRDPEGHHYAWCATHQRIVPLTQVEPGPPDATSRGARSLPLLLP